MVQLLSTKSSKQVRLNHVSWSFFIFILSIQINCENITPWFCLPGKFVKIREKKICISQYKNIYMFNSELFLLITSDCQYHYQQTNQYAVLLGVHMKTRQRIYVLYVFINNSRLLSFSRILFLFLFASMEIYKLFSFLQIYFMNNLQILTVSRILFLILFACF